MNESVSFVEITTSTSLTLLVTLIFLATFMTVLLISVGGVTWYRYHSKPRVLEIEMQEMGSGVYRSTLEQRPETIVLE